MKFADVVLYILSLIALLVIAASVIFFALGLHDANFAQCAAATGGIVFAGILWVLTKIAERLEPVHLNLSSSATNRTSTS